MYIFIVKKTRIQTNKLGYKQIIEKSAINIL